MNKFIIKSIVGNLFIKSISDLETVWTSKIEEALHFNRIGDAMRVAVCENDKNGEIISKVIYSSF